MSNLEPHTKTDSAESLSTDGLGIWTRPRPLLFQLCTLDIYQTDKPLNKGVWEIIGFEEMDSAQEAFVLRQALDVLVNLSREMVLDPLEARAITALRTALDAAETVEEQLSACQKERDVLLRKVEYWRDTAKAALAKVGKGE